MIRSDIKKRIKNNEQKMKEWKKKRKAKNDKNHID